MVRVTCEFTLLRRQRLRSLASSFVRGFSRFPFLAGYTESGVFQMRVGFFRSAGTIAIFAMFFLPCTRMRAQFFGGPSAISADSIPQSELLQPEELNSLLKAQGGEKPVVLQVGSLLMFREAHIVGAEFAGAGSQAVGLQQLQKRVSPLTHSTFIVLYCGCCPWNHCPNVGPAFKLLHDFGFTHVKVLYLASNFGADWVDKGFPVDRHH